MKIRIFILSLICFCSTLATSAQQKTISALEIGDHVPDIVFQHLRNTTDSTQKASAQYHKGLLIINFWATWCVPCVEGLPFLDAVQEKFKDRCTIFCLTNESDEALSKFLSNHKFLPHLAFAANDTILSKFFSHRTLPHNIWIDKDGIVRAITGDEEINEKNIKEFLEGKTSLPAKDDDMSFDWDKPLRVADSEFVYRSVISPAKLRIGNGGVFPADSMAEHTRFLAWNRSKTDLIWAACARKPMQVRDWKLVEIHTRDSSSFFYPRYTKEPNWTMVYGLAEYNKWSGKNQFCYELSFSKKVSLDAFYKLMTSEMELFFDVKTRIEFRPTQCWVITKMPTYKYIPTNGTELLPLQIEGFTYVAKNQTVGQLAGALSETYSMEPPVIDQTGIKDLVSIDIDFSNSPSGLSLKMVKEYLNTIGLDMSLKKCPYPILVIDDQHK